MDPLTSWIIIAIVAIIIILELDKHQRRRITANLHNDNLKQLLTLTALEYRQNVADDKCKDDQKLTNKITKLINSYETGEMDAAVFEKKMDQLLNKLN